MVKPKTPNSGQTVELLVETIRARILDRIDEVEIERTGVRKTVVERGKTLKRVNPQVYRDIERLSKQLKSLKRGLGGLLTSDPNKVINPKTGETWGQLVSELVNNDIKGPELASRLAKFGAFVDAKSNVNPGRVGHHRTGLGILREILKDKPFDYRTKFKQIAESKGYQIGEEFIDFIDPAAHKEFTTKVGVALSKRLGYAKRSDVPENLMNAIAERYAHAKQFGSNEGWAVPTGWLKEGVDEETLFKFSQPYLEAAKRGADAGLQLDEILTKGVWETPEQLIEQVNKVALNQTDDLFDIYGNQLGTKLTGKQKAIQKVDLEALAKLGLSPDDLNQGLFKSKVNPIVQAVVGRTPAGKIARVAGALPVIGATVDVGIAAASTKTAIEDPSTKNVLRAGGNWLEAVDQTPFFVGPGINALIHRGTDENYDPTKGPEKLLSTIKEGEKYTTTTTDDTVVGSMMRNIQGTNVVKDEETDEYYEYTIPRI